MATRRQKSARKSAPKTRTKPAADPTDISAARARLEALGTPHTAQLAALLARVQKEGDRVLLDVAREGIALILRRPSAERLRQQLAAVAEAVDRAGPDAPVSPRVLHIARLAERLLGNDERLARYGEQLHQLALAPAAEHGRRFAGRKRGAVNPLTKRLREYFTKHPGAAFDTVLLYLQQHGAEEDPAITVTSGCYNEATGLPDDLVEWATGATWWSSITKHPDRYRRP